MPVTSYFHVNLICIRTGTCRLRNDREKLPEEVREQIIDNIQHKSIETVELNMHVKFYDQIFAKRMSFSYVGFSLISINHPVMF